MSDQAEHPHAEQGLADRIRAFWEKHSFWIVFGGTIVAFLTGVFSFKAGVESIARTAVLDESTIRKLAVKVRPTIIFNTKEAIESDLGGSDYVRAIKVVPEPTKYGYRITVDAAQHLIYPPILTCIDANLYPTQVERGHRHSWNFLMIPNPNTGTFLARETMDTNAVYRFKLEVLH